LLLFGRYGYVQMTRFLMMFLLSFCSHAPFMVATSSGGVSRPLYGGVFTTGGYGEEFFFNMSGSVIGVWVHLLRCFTFQSQVFLWTLSVITIMVRGCVHLSYTETGSIALSNKMPFIGKKNPLDVFLACSPRLLAIKLLYIPLNWLSQ
jgi:hypothetical protein